MIQRFLRRLAVVILVLIFGVEVASADTQFDSTGVEGYCINVECSGGEDDATGETEEPSENPEGSMEGGRTGTGTIPSSSDGAVQASYAHRTTRHHKRGSQRKEESSRTRVQTVTIIVTFDNRRNLIDVIGPFSSEKDAQEYGEKYFEGFYLWRIKKLLHPGGYSVPTNLPRRHRPPTD